MADATNAISTQDPDQSIGSSNQHSLLRRCNMPKRYQDLKCESVSTKLQISRTPLLNFWTSHLGSTQTTLGHTLHICHCLTASPAASLVCKMALRFCSKPAALQWDACRKSGSSTWQWDGTTHMSLRRQLTALEQQRTHDEASYSSNQRAANGRRGEH